MSDMMYSFERTEQLSAMNRGDKAVSTAASVWGTLDHSRYAGTVRACEARVRVLLPAISLTSEPGEDISTRAARRMGREARESAG